MLRTQWRFLTSLLCVLGLQTLTSCGGSDPSFSILPEEDAFTVDSILNNKIDILFVIDNSGSMQDNQNNVASNFNAFISDFSTKSYDYKLAVTASDAWRHLYVSNQAQKQALVEFRDGTSTTGFTGVKVVVPGSVSPNNPTLWPDVIALFAHHIRQGTSGSGDERPLQSFTEALDSTYNTGFLRPDAYLAVVMVTDEEDFSWNGSSCKQCNNDYTNLYPVQNYVDKLNVYKNNDTTKYSVSGIIIQPGDSACLAANNPWGRYADRVNQLISQTNGVVGSICDTSFANTLDAIQTKIAEESTQFFLSRIPIVSTIVVHINGVLIPQDALNGWTYESATNSVKFHGNALPSQGDIINIDYDPAGLIE